MGRHRAAAPVEHWRGLAAVAGVVATGALLTGRAPEAALLALAVAVGLPHGALDMVVGERAFRAIHGTHWRRAFLLRYLALVAATLATWSASPAAATILFLLLSCAHFGASDAPTAAPFRAMRVLAHGGAIAIVPAACHVEAVESLLAVLAPAGGHAIAAGLSGPAAVAWAAAVLGTLAIYVRRDRWEAAADLILVALLFAVASPLVAFSLYFALIHTPRAWAASTGGGPVPAWRLVVPTALALGLGVAILLTGRHLAPDENAARAVFILLAALTVPHMWLEWQLRHGPAGERQPATPEMG